MSVLAFATQNAIANLEQKYQKQIKDIQDNLRNLWKDWTNHFHLLFVEKQEGVLYEELI